MKSSLLFLCVLFQLASMAQVGIGTTNPQQELHISGNSSTIRIDGLNSSNNPSNIGDGLYPVKVNSSGDLSLGSSPEALVSITNSMTEVNLQTTATAGLSSIELYARSFTLTQRSLVMISYTVAIEVKSFDDTGYVDDGRAKILHNYYYLGDGTNPISTTAYGLTSSVYTNSNCENTASGYMLNSNTSMQILDAGTHSIHFFGAVFGGGLSSDASFSANFGNQERLEVKVIPF